MSVVTSIGRALERGGAPPGDATADRILDAVLAELVRTPLRKLALEDVARRARTSRMTVYRRFGDREGLLDAAIARESSRFLSAVLAADDPSAPAEERIAEAFATGLRLVHSHPLLSHWLATDPGELLNGVLAENAKVLRAGSAFLAAAVADLGGDDAERRGELLGRLFVALVLMPPPSTDLTDPGQARALARELIAPIVVRG
jgi:AcrR family transcriptional regulator